MVSKNYASILIAVLAILATAMLVLLVFGVGSSGAQSSKLRIINIRVDKIESNWRPPGWDITVEVYNGYSKPIVIEKLLVNGMDYTSKSSLFGKLRTISPHSSSAVMFSIYFSDGFSPGQVVEIELITTEGERVSATTVLPE